MALNITTLDDINSANTKIISAHEKYQTALDKIRTIIRQSESSWDSMTAKESRERVLSALDNEMTHRGEEMLAQSNFLKDTSKILIESQEEIKDTLS